jgi:peptide/nickel transport system substrate-binding protein
VRNFRTRRGRVTTVVAAVTAVAAAVGLVSCGKRGRRPDAPGTDVPGVPAVPDPLPADRRLLPEPAGVVNNITDRLLWQDPDTLQLYPWIATDLPEINADATEFTFHLRDGVTYSDGSPLTADNVVRNFDLFGKGNKAHKLTASEQISTYDHGEVLDDHTVRFTSPTPNPASRRPPAPSTPDCSPIPPWT